mgnify:FL=1
MEKIKNKIHNLSLRKTLWLLLTFIIATITLLTSVTVLFLANGRQDILDSRTLEISNYKLETTYDNNTYILEPYQYTFSELTPDKELKYNIYSILIILLPCIYIIVGVFISVYIYYKLKLNKPIQELTKGIDHLLNYDLDFTINYESEDELGKLCNSLNLVRQELYSNNQKMWNMLNERKALTSSISHDLRTPITVIKGYLEYLTIYLKDGKIPPKTIYTTIDNINEAINRLENYVSCIQDIQKIDNIELNPMTEKTRDFLQHFKSEFNIIAKNKNKNLFIFDSLYSDEMIIDKQVVFRILENILDNAFRFATSDIKVYISENNDFLEFKIIDDGKGFSEEDLKNATELFYTSKSNSGLFGIGLTFSKILCEKHNGSIKFKNSKDKGALVLVKIKKL